MRITLRQFNNILSLVVVGLCLYVILAPLWPKFAYQVQKVPKLVAEENNGEGIKQEDIPKENTLVMPTMNLQETMHAGGEEALNKGIWHMPGTGNPIDGGNMVLSGHRFTYGGPAVLYHMDKVKEGDKIVVYWNQEKHEYKVDNVMVVPPTRTEVQEQTEDHILTIYTCTPLVTAKDRLVIQAKPVGEES